MRRLGHAMAVLIVLVVSAGLIHAGATPAQKCAVAKQKAAAKKVSAKLKCWQKAIAAGTASADPACLTTAETKFTTAVAKAETKGGCVETGEAGVIENTVDTCVNNIVARTPSTNPCSGSGVLFGGSCWYIGPSTPPLNQSSCDTVCAGVGLACDDAATRDVAGSGGTLASCGAIIDALVPATAPNPQLDVDATSSGSLELGIGCAYFIFPIPPLFPEAKRFTAPTTTCAATGVGGTVVTGTRRACACQ
jgi:hypothetical protein